MRPEALFERFPYLFRLAMRGAEDGIRSHGLLTAHQIAERAGLSLPTTPRPSAIRRELPEGTVAWITDNGPLTFAKLNPCLDHGLTPEDWLALLNDRVLFWPDAKTGPGNLKARRRFGYASEWQVYDSRRLLMPVWDHVEIAPINTGWTLHRPARRGGATSAKAADTDFDGWRGARGKKTPDVVKEIAVPGDPRSGRGPRGDATGLSGRSSLAGSFSPALPIPLPASRAGARRCARTRRRRCPRRRAIRAGRRRT